MMTLMISRIFEAYRRLNVSDGGFQRALARFLPAFEKHLKDCLFEKKSWSLIPGSGAYMLWFREGECSVKIYAKFNNR